MNLIEQIDVDHSVIKLFNGEGLKIASFDTISDVQPITVRERYGTGVIGVRGVVGTITENLTTSYEQLETSAVHSMVDNSIMDITNREIQRIESLEEENTRLRNRLEVVERAVRQLRERYYVSEPIR